MHCLHEDKETTSWKVRLDLSRFADSGSAEGTEGAAAQRLHLEVIRFQGRAAMELFVLF